MSHDRTSPQGRPDNETAWFRDGAVPHAREDRLAEAVALIALLFSLGIGLVIALLPVSVHAATPAAPSLELQAFKIVPARPGSPEHLVPATEARSGDQLEYQAVYRNPTAVAVHHVMVTVPVPANGVEYVLETAAPRADLASTDGKTFAQLPLQRVETAADGRKVSKPAPGADYRFLRWDLGDVPAGATRTVRTRVQLLATTVAAR
jgi:hypothetical protein